MENYPNLIFIIDLWHRREVFLKIIFCQFDSRPIALSANEREKDNRAISTVVRNNAMRHNRIVQRAVSKFKCQCVQMRRHWKNIAFDPNVLYSIPFWTFLQFLFFFS